jgi:mono/diheme cytochrome c family protein
MRYARVALVGLFAALACDGKSSPAKPVAIAAPDVEGADAGAPRPAEADAELAFVRDGHTVRTVARSALEAAVPPETWTAFDPYYGRPKTYRALPIAKALAFAFGAPVAELEKLDYVLRASDGYTVPFPGGKLFEKGGYFAVADVEVPGWEPIGPQRANPGPFYVVWREPSQASIENYPRPWQLEAIEITPFEAAFPHAVPTGARPDSPVARGFHLFREECIHCHAMNREGGRVGPDLNVPQSIVEYRPAAQIRAYVKDPRTFRYSNMPAHPSITDADLDALLAYFGAMKERKFDPDSDASDR